MKAASEDATSMGLAITELIREYLDNGLTVYDAQRRRFGTVADYDRSGGCFVVRTSAPEGALCIPFSFVREVRRGRVYVSKSANDLSARLLDLAAPEAGSSGRWFRRLSGNLARWRRV